MDTHRVAVYAFDPLPSFEVGVAAEVFGLARPELGVAWWYEVALFGVAPGRVGAVGGFGVDVPHGLEALEHAGTVLVPGTGDVTTDPPAVLLEALRAAAGRGTRMVSICSGAFVLAAAGLLDGRRVATHWRYARRLAERFPALEVDARVLYVDDGDVMTSAGTAAGIDLCLHVVRSDHGADVANQVARRMVVSPHRAGDQAQYAELPRTQAAGEDPVARAQAWALERLGEPISVADMARAVHLSERSLTRRFAAVTGTGPASWLRTQRMAVAAALLETTGDPVEHVGAAVGVPSPAAFRRHFARATGVSPSAYRRAFRAGRRAA